MTAFVKQDAKSNACSTSQGDQQPQRRVISCLGQTCNRFGRRYRCADRLLRLRGRCRGRVFRSIGAGCITHNHHAIFQQRPVVEDQPVLAGADIDIRFVEQVAIFILALHQLEADVFCQFVSVGRCGLHQSVYRIKFQPSDFGGRITADPLANYVAVLVLNGKGCTRQFLITSEFPFRHISSGSPSACRLSSKAVFSIYQPSSAYAGVM